MHRQCVLSRRTMIGWKKRITKQLEREEADAIKIRPSRSDKVAPRFASWGRAVTGGALGKADFCLPSNATEKISLADPRVIRFFDRHRLFCASGRAGCGFSLFKVRFHEEKKSKKEFIVGCGLNSSSQLGEHNVEEDELRFYQMLAEPVKIPLMLRNGEFVKDFNAGRAHSIFLTTHNRILALGANNYGQCGHENMEAGFVVGGIHEVPHTICDDLEYVTCGCDHSVIKTKTGRLYAFGLNTDGQLGRGDPELACSHRVEEVRISDPVLYATGRMDTTLALTKNNRVFGWGNCEYGQFGGSTPHTQAFTPILLQFPTHVGDVTCVSASGTATHFVNSSGDVYAMGFGPIGLATEQSLTPTLIPPSLFGRGKFGNEGKVKSIRCGLDYAIAKTTSFEFYSWGNNMFGQLGLSHRNIQRQPARFKSTRAKAPKWRAYLNLIRFDKQIGSHLLFLPCSWGLALGCHGVIDFNLIDNMLRMFMGAFLMRSAGCVINDLWDRDIDGKVERTKHRPLAAGDLTVRDAFICLSTLLGASFALLLSLKQPCIALGFAAMPFVVVYPYCKRITDYPQVVLGLAFSFGTVIGYAAMVGKIDVAICAPLYLASVLWTIFYDTIYAHQDKNDDVLIGVRSTALRFGEQTKPILLFLSAGVVGLLAVAGFNAELNPIYAIGLLPIAWHSIRQVTHVDLNSGESCWKTFTSNRYFGAFVFANMLIAQILR